MRAAGLIRYVYPIRQVVSFTLVAQNHISALARRGVLIAPWDWSNFIDRLMPGRTLLHPLWYPFIGPGTRGRDLFFRLHGVARLGGFDVVETTGLSEEAVSIANALDFLVVPSNWSARMAARAGVKVPIYVAPHGLSKAFLSEPRPARHPAVRELAELRRQGNKLVYFHLWHSGRRKGADLVRKVMERVQQSMPNALLVIKRTPSLLDPYLGMLRELRHVEVAEWLGEEDLVSLYDQMDACLCLSRGGGFELVALEAAARGVPTLVPRAGCFLDYCDWLVPVEVAREVPNEMQGNPIHTGAGFEADWEDAAEKLLQILSEGRRLPEENVELLRRTYTWERAGEVILYALKRQGWLD
ncbi:MAG: glycosyltransferase [Candidatus Hadarchaeales archaeon]